MASKYARHTDEDLFTLIVGGDKDAFVELYTRYRGRIYAYALRMLGDRDRANDVFQETFTRIYNRCREHDRQMSNVSAYIFTTARNICLNVIRNSKPSSAVEDYHEIVFQPSHENVELAELVKRSLELLPQHHREAFILREYDGLSYQEIADAVGVPIGTVRSRLARGRAMMRKALEDYARREGYLKEGSKDD